MFISNITIKIPRTAFKNDSRFLAEKKNVRVDRSSTDEEIEQADFYDTAAELLSLILSNMAQ